MDINLAPGTITLDKMVVNADPTAQPFVKFNLTVQTTVGPITEYGWGLFRNNTTKEYFVTGPSFKNANYVEGQSKRRAFNPVYAAESVKSVVLAKVLEFAGLANNSATI